MNIPTELATARKTAETAWKLYEQIVDDPNATKEQKTAALLKANQLDNTSHQWYMRWQAVGGTSDIESIVEAELAAARTVSPAAVILGPQEPPDDYRIWNKRQPDGTFKPLSLFFDEAVQKADAAALTSGELENMQADHDDWLDHQRTMEDARP